MLLIYLLFISPARNKVQLQLQAIVKKYDNTIRDKMIIVVNLDSELNTVNEDLEKLMKIHDKEYAIYKRIILKDEQQKEQEKVTRILQFTMNFAARQIQRYWRKWRKSRLRESRSLKQVQKQKQSKSIK